MTYNRVYVLVNLDALRHNIKLIRDRVNTKVMFVIKANAYGHGAVEAARAASGIADFFAVATVDEAVDLRRAGIKEPILVLGYVSPEYFGLVAEHDISQTIFDLESARLLAEAGGKAHIALDTGMGRIGFPADGEGIDKIIKACETGLNIEGIFTHFASADESDKSFTIRQFEKFKYVTDELEKRGINIPIKHVSNSAAAIDMPEYALDMVRLGIAAYGMQPSDSVQKLDLKTALSWRSHVVNVKKVPKGTPISYGRTFVTQRESVIATIPVGYADGYPRALSNKGRVVINGKTAPIAGRVCMDQMMADVTDIGEVRVGDDVSLIDDIVTADEIARLDGTINYEVVCRISSRVPRIYQDEADGKAR